MSIIKNFRVFVEQGDTYKVATCIELNFIFGQGINNTYELNDLRDCISDYLNINTNEIKFIVN